MPTTPRRARLWLEAKRARIVRRDPFTIRLRFATKVHVQAAKVGVDTGSKDVGIAATTNGEVVFQAEVHLRDDITEKLRQRRRYRHNRRGRKTRYREARSANRRRPDGWLEITPHKLGRLARPTQGWMITRHPVMESISKEGGASSPVEAWGYPCRQNHGKSHAAS